MFARFLRAILILTTFGALTIAAIGWWQARADGEMLADVKPLPGSDRQGAEGVEVAETPDDDGVPGAIPGETDDAEALDRAMAAIDASMRESQGTSETEQDAANGEGVANAVPAGAGGGSRGDGAAGVDAQEEAASGGSNDAVAAQESGGSDNALPGSGETNLAGEDGASGAVEGQRVQNDAAPQGSENGAAADDAVVAGAGEEDAAPGAAEREPRTRVSSLWVDDLDAGATPGPRSSNRLDDAVAAGRNAYAAGDFHAAYARWLAAAQAGDARAQYFVGGLFYEGRPMEKNTREARRWLERALENGDTRAAALLDRIASEAAG